MNTVLGTVFDILSHQGMHIRIALSFHLTTVRMAITKTTRDSTGKDGEERGSLIGCRWECNICSHYEITVQVPQKIINKTTI